MIARPFTFEAPENLDVALALLADCEQGGVILGGGTMLVPAMTRGETNPKLLVDLRRLNLTDIVDEGDHLLIQARVSYDQVLQSQLIALHAPVLAQMASGVTGGRSITSQGTLVGSACYANPASDVPACLAALDARIRLASVHGVRDTRVEDFFIGGFQTARHDDEICLGIVIRKSLGRTSSAYRKVKPSGSAWPIITVACVIEETSAGTAALTLAIGGLDATPIRATTIDPFEIAEDLVARLVGSVRSPWEDALADASYRSLAAPAIAMRVMREALEAHNG